MIELPNRQNIAPDQGSSLLSSADVMGDRLRWTELGRAYCRERQIQPDIFIGYGNNKLRDGHDPWGKHCHVAVFAYPAAGGPEIVAAGKPVLGNDRWLPLAPTRSPEEGFNFGSTFSTFITIHLAVTFRELLIKPVAILDHEHGNYFEWIGFLKALQISGG